MLSFNDLYEALYGDCINEQTKAEARKDIQAMPDNEWHAWICFRNRAQGKKCSCDC